MNKTAPPHRLFAAPLVLLAALSALLGPVARSAADDIALADALEALTERTFSLAGADLGVHVREADAERTLFAHRADEPLIPASNLKLITTGAALITLGTDHTFETTIAVHGDDLVVIGSGDPGFGDPALLERSDPPLTVEDLLGSIVEAVRTAGVSDIDEIIVDDRVFDREAVHESWPRDQLNRWYCAEVAGLNFHTNCITFDVRPGDGPAGVAPLVSLVPDADWMPWTNRAETIARGRTTAWVARPRPENRFTVFGNVHRRAPALIDVALHDPALTFGRYLADRLSRVGVSVGGHTTPSRAVGRARLADETETFDGARPVAVVRTAMADALRRANVNSQNLYTEALLKAVGHAVTGEPGSWTNGGAVVRMIVSERLGPEHARSLRIADGAGLSRDNRIAAETMTAWLAEFLGDDRLGPALLDSMATPGEGTLRNRFRDDKLSAIVHAKSGTIRGVRCLSGVVTSPRTGRRILFSVLANGLDSTAAVRGAKRFHEQVVDTIDDWLLETETEVAGAGDGPGDAFGG